MTAKDTVYTMEEIAKHASADDLWMVIEDKVYDMTSFLDDHPGGRRLPLRSGGKDACE